MNETLQTHWSDCWREPGHHACAIRRIEQLEAQLTKRDAPCVWKFDSDVFEYVSCTGDWFDERMKFCPDCGHPVQRETHDNAKKRNERLTRKGCETMKARDYNASITALFFGGDALAAVLADGQRQLAELVEEEHEYLRKLRQREVASLVALCPCGCGLVGDICEKRLMEVYLADQELPF